MTIHIPTQKQKTNPLHRSEFRLSAGLMLQSSHSPHPTKLPPSNSNFLAGDCQWHWAFGLYCCSQYGLTPGKTERKEGVKPQGLVCWMSCGQAGGSTMNSQSVRQSVSQEKSVKINSGLWLRSQQRLMGTLCEKPMWIEPSLFALG